ncbi:serine/threonine-protein kinase OXI1-like [Euphorbia lathyris]|uniref:serine/threonine-protein kinase OXI1-like n=1 Tax=Euphorbia lathyris TaxID=212925 RepID=UPI00331385BF
MNSLDKIVPILNLEDLKVISPLGRGAKGLVFLVKQDQCPQLWALKVILRDLIEKKNKDVSTGNEYKRVCFERQVLSHFKHPLLPSLRGVLATDKIVAYAIDFCPGRDLNYLRKQQTESTFSVDIIRFYSAELVLALEYLHKIGIAYRDLKPENILVQENGHIMLVDFDLSTKISPSRHKSPSSDLGAKQHPFRRRRSFFSRFCNSGITPDDSSDDNPIVPEPEATEKSNSFVGTEEYVAPEIIQGYGHDFAVDIWSLGVVIYEMLYGVTPFKGSNRKETFFRILTKAPDLVGEATPLRDLIRKLLVREPRERIKLEEIKRHEFFEGINWEMLMQLSRPPYIPPTSHEFWVTEGKEGIMKIDVESFVQRIFGGDEVGNQKDKEDENEKQKQKQLPQQDEGTNTNKGVWVNGLDNTPENHNFLVF